MRALVTGWFSFELMGATAGDLLARDVVCEWLATAGCPFDVAMSRSLGGGVQWDEVNPADYTHVVFVCGPLGNGAPATDLFARFSGSRLVGLDLSMLHPLSEWNPFDLLLERDSSETARPDITFLSTPGAVPVVGAVLVHVQREYPGGRHDEVHAAIEQLLGRHDVATVRIDTSLDPANSTGLRTPAEVSSLIARMDAIVTTRLHGLVLALRAGVPALAIDPVSGGAKVARQAAVIGWPWVLTPEEVTAASLDAALDACLGEEARQVAARCARQAVESLDEARARFLAEFTTVEAR